MNRNKLNFNRGRVLQEIINQKFILKLEKPNDTVFKIAAVKLLCEDEIEYVSGCFQTTAETQQYCKRTWKNHVKAITAASHRRRKKDSSSTSNSTISVSLESVTSSQELINEEGAEAQKEKRTTEDELNDKLDNM